MGDSFRRIWARFPCGRASALSVYCSGFAMLYRLRWVGRAQPYQLLSCLKLASIFYPCGRCASRTLWLWAQSYLSNSVAYRAGTARLDPPNPFNIAKFTPITVGYPINTTGSPETLASLRSSSSNSAAFAGVGPSSLSVATSALGDTLSSFADIPSELPGKYAL